MAPEKVTEMILNVDLKCSGCYKKVKKVICKIPQIRDQMFDVDQNKVKIIVVCCSPEKIRDKLCYKGGGAIQSIEIIEKPPAGKPGPPADTPKPPADKPKPPADKPPEKPKPPADKPPEKPKPPAEKPADKPADKPKPPANKPKPPADKPQDGEKSKDAPKKADAGLAKMVYEPVHGYPQMYPPSAYPMVGYGQYYDQGYGGAPFQHGYGMPIAPPPPPPSYGGFGYEYGYNGYNNGYNGNRTHYGGEEDGEGCSIM